MSTILIENGAVLTVDDAGTLHKPGYVYIEDGKIAAVGAGAAPESLRTVADQRIDAARA